MIGADGAIAAGSGAIGFSGAALVEGGTDGTPVSGIRWIALTDGDGITRGGETRGGPIGCWTAGALRRPWTNQRDRSSTESVSRTQERRNVRWATASRAKVSRRSVSDVNRILRAFMDASTGSTRATSGSDRISAISGSSQHLKSGRYNSTPPGLLWRHLS